MGTSGVRETSDPGSGWLEQYSERAAEYKRHLEATYCEKRAERAEARGNLDAAVDYYDRAVTKRGRLGDREAAIDLGMRLAAAARESGDLDTAKQHYERVAELHSRRKNASGALDAIEPLLAVLDEQGNRDDLHEWWGNALMILGRAEEGDVSPERRDDLIRRYAEHVYAADSPARIYGWAFEKLQDGETAFGEKLLYETWKRRDVVPENRDVFRLVLAAGVGWAARVEVAADDHEVAGADETDPQEVLSVVAEHREMLSRPGTALFEKLHEGETDVDAESLRVDLEAGEEPPELRELESETFGALLARL